MLYTRVVPCCMARTYISYKNAFVSSPPPPKKMRRILIAFSGLPNDPRTNHQIF